MKEQSAEKAAMKSNMHNILKEKKKLLSHCMNLECQKEQLLVLIEKLYKISGDRLSSLPEIHGQNSISKHLNNAGSYLFSISEQLMQAQKNRKQIDKEILETKKQIKNMENILKNKEQ